jgi:hypothetical protein
VTSQFGFVADATLIGATNNYGFFGNIPSGTNRWNLYMSGTANNYLAGSLGIGSTSVGSGINLNMAKTMTGAATQWNIYNQSQIQSDVTSLADYFRTSASTVAATFTLPNIVHYRSAQGTFGAGSTVTNQYGFLVEASLIGATNNYAFAGLLASGTNRWNLYMAGTAANYMAGNLNIGTTLDTGSSLQVYKPYLAGVYSLDAGTGGIAGISEVARFYSNGNGGTGRGVGIVIGAAGSLNTVSVARLIGYQENASATANNASFAIEVANTSGTLTERIRVKNTGQMRFVPLASDPLNAQAGDVYYNSTISALKLYDGTVWRTITVI